MTDARKVRLTELLTIEPQAGLRQATEGPDPELPFIATGMVSSGASTIDRMPTEITRARVKDRIVEDGDLLLVSRGIERFDSVKNFFSYCRVVPGAANSAGKRRHAHRKDGNRHLKLALSHAAVRAIQHFPDIKRFYQRKARQKNPAIARTLVQKELARAAYIVLHDQVDFNHTFKGQPLSKRKAEQWPRKASPHA